MPKAIVSCFFVEGGNPDGVEQGRGGGLYSKIIALQDISSIYLLVADLSGQMYP